MSESTAEEVLTPTEQSPAPLAPVPKQEDEFNQMVRVARAMVASGYFAGTASVAQAVVRMLAGKELNIPPVAAMQGVYIVRGRVSLSANIVGALIKRSSKYDFRIVQHSNTGCEIEFFERNFTTGVRESVGKSAYSIEDARRAGLLRKDSPWESHPKNMVFARALTNGARWFTPDVFNGPVYTPEELREPQDDESTLPQEEASDASSDTAE